MLLFTKENKNKLPINTVYEIEDLKTRLNINDEISISTFKNAIIGDDGISSILATKINNDTISICTDDSFDISNPTEISATIELQSMIGLAFNSNNKIEWVNQYLNKLSKNKFNLKITSNKHRVSFFKIIDAFNTHCILVKLDNKSLKQYITGEHLAPGYHLIVVKNNIIFSSLNQIPYIQRQNGDKVSIKDYSSFLYPRIGKAYIEYNWGTKSQLENIYQITRVASSN
ncbi:hypothetical protein [Photobacterium leiognathi]|uniref:hypothetical protein n=1 Tax=Photobacterium leiognathi TaxID=553611 RepID=UPI0029823F11|nr:hypothetical protein [Photobacterium leiognathi]